MVDHRSNWTIFQKHIYRKVALCIIDEFLSMEELYTRTLRYINNKGDCNKENRQQLISVLEGLGIPIKRICQLVGLKPSDIFNNYKYDTSIPIQYINEHTTETTMNWIAKTNLDKIVKEFLYERAGLPERHLDRLTVQKVEFLKKILKNNTFKKLTPH